MDHRTLANLLERSRSNPQILFERPDLSNTPRFSDPRRGSHRSTSGSQPSAQSTQVPENRRQRRRPTRTVQAPRQRQSSTQAQVQAGAANLRRLNDLRNRVKACFRKQYNLHRMIAQLIYMKPVLTFGPWDRYTSQGLVEAQDYTRRSIPSYLHESGMDEHINRLSEDQLRRIVDADRQTMASLRNTFSNLYFEIKGIVDGMEARARS